MMHPPTRLWSLGVVLLVAISAISAAPAQSAPTATLPTGTTYWKVSDFDGVDCAECGGFRVLRRTSSNKAKLAFVTQYDNGTTSVSCTRLSRTASGAWRDSHRTYWAVTGKKLKASGIGWWVIMSRAPKSAVNQALDTAFLRRAYKNCLVS